MMRQFFTLWLFFFVCVLFGCVEAGWGAETLSPGIYVPDDLIAEPESVTLTSVGTDEFDEATFKQPLEETFNLEVYELSPGVYQFVNDPAAKTDQAALYSDIDAVNLSAVVADSGADGVLFRGTGSYPGETAITFGLINEYPELPVDANGNIDYEATAAEVGYKLYTGRRYFNVDGVIAAFENLSIGDHANNNTGIVHTFGGGRTFMNDVWIYNVYDGIFFDDAADAYFVNCILHQTYQPWNTLLDAQEAGYFTDDWNALVEIDGLSGTPYAEGVGLSEEDYSHLAGVIMGNDTANGFNINLIETEGADPQYLYFKNCTIIRHQIRDTNRLWRHNTGGSAVLALIEDCMILCVDLDPNAQIRIDTDDPDFFGYMNNSKFWNYASGDAQVSGITMEYWNFNPNDQISLDDNSIDLSTPGGLNVTDASELFRVDGRKLTEFKEGAVELTLASDGGAVGYRLPETAPDGPLPVTTGEVAAVSNWSLF